MKLNDTAEVRLARPFLELDVVRERLHRVFFCVDEALRLACNANHAPDRRLKYIKQTDIILR